MVFDYSWYATAELPTVLTGTLRRRRELRGNGKFVADVYVLPASYTEDDFNATLEVFLREEKGYERPWCVMHVRTSMAMKNQTMAIFT